MNNFRLKKVSKREQLSREVISIINNGELKPGDRLLSAREFAAKYQINLRTVLAALKELVTAEILENIPRKGYFVRKDIEIPVRLNGHDELQSLTGKKSTIDPAHLLDPIPRSRQLSLYISDTAEGQLAVWQEMLSDFRSKFPGVSLELLTGYDGHVQDLLGERTIDVFHSTAKLLNRCQRDGTDFIKLNNLRAVGIEKNQLLKPVQKFIEHDYNFFGIPFSLDMHLLYVNCDLEKKLSSWFRVPESFDDLLPSLKLKSKMHSEGIGVAEYKFFYLLKAGGGIDFPGRNSRIEINPQQILKILEKVKQSNVRLVENTSTRETPMFRTGKYPFLFHRTQMVSIMVDDSHLNWRVAAIPKKSNGTWKDLHCLAINKDTQHLHETLELIKHLCSFESQVKFTGLFGRLPILRRAMQESSVLNGEYIEPEVILETLNRGEIAPPFTVEEANFEDEINSCGQSFQAGMMTAEEVLARIEFMYEYYFSETAMV